MESLKSIHDNLQKIDEKNIVYTDVFEHPELIYGNVNNNSKLNFSKFPNDIREEMKEYGDNVYTLENGVYVHQRVISPGNGIDTFAEEISVPENGEICVFLPNYNTIKSFYIGLDKDSSFETLKYPSGKQLPVLFYGNAVTQGASASRSGNTFTNIVSRKLNRDIINLSCSSCCKATDKTAEYLGKINCHAIVIDYTQNAYDTHVFRRTHERFYKKVREYHPDRKIILLTSENFNFWKSYDEFDEIVENTYNNAKVRGENVTLVKQRELFDEDEYDLVSIDNTHYSDYGMYRVAEKICELIEEK